MMAKRGRQARYTTAQVIMAILEAGDGSDLEDSDISDAEEDNISEPSDNSDTESIEPPPDNEPDNEAGRGRGRGQVQDGEQPLGHGTGRGWGHGRSGGRGHGRGREELPQNEADVVPEQAQDVLVVLCGRKLHQMLADVGLKTSSDRHYA